ncbi:ABC transporter substrate-binding protein [Pseudomaricurvus sp. HS19]|uniref:ABC transporter substrate-binding protein n=1 Tax=Pseudomaricurvus sp. HS19 TaxID=2692626 RepID=UPI00136C5E6C|nr:ABC transporter substrate-binding protein [Pseudomaricurvus sp. HS19]MYM64870.1 branched-chain amino acid ABC transporter substrate-binding protein [Pseudomaricurvus sp. HS19]
MTKLTPCHLLMLLCWICLLRPGTVLAAETGTEAEVIGVLYLRQQMPPKPVLSNVRAAPDNLGVAGALLGRDDNNTIARFIGQRFAIETFASADADQLLAAASQWIAAGNSFIVADLPTPTLLSMLQQPALRDRAVVFNATNKDDQLRQLHCQAHLLHTIPSRAMLTDALTQLLIKKRWQNWLLVTGLQPGDQLYATALQRSAKRFGGKFVDSRQWQTESDLRRSAQQEIPRFTQARDYDVVLVADEPGDIGEYLPYNTWLPRPVAGTQGLTATAWHWSIEQWGAAQLQNRFRDLHQREMAETDYAAWLALRALGEAVTRTRSPDRTTVYDYLLSENFQLSAFKGRALSFRPWNGQLRQPIPLVQPNAVVSQSPQDGYLHPYSTMDTLGFDRSEVKCSMSVGHTES